MLEKFLVLLERFVVAHELIAANSSKTPAITVVPLSEGTVAELKRTSGKLTGGALEAGPKEPPVEGENVIDTPAAEEKPKRKKAAKPAPEPEADDLADEPEPEEKKPVKKEVDLTPLRDEIKQIAKHIAAGESDKCADLFDELLEDYGVRTVTKLSDDDVVKFHTDAKALVVKYYDVEED